MPVIYLADWPDIYIHTNKDVPGNLDSTKMKRAMFIAAASAWALVNLDQGDMRALERLQMAEGDFRRADLMRRASGLEEADAVAAWSRHAENEVALEDSLARFGLQVEGAGPGEAAAPVPAEAGGIVYRRADRPKGPMNGFGYSWLDDQLKKARLERPALLSREPAFEGPSYGYEALNLVDGKRSIGQIRDELAATVGPVPVEEVTAYLAVLERLGVIRR